MKTLDYACRGTHSTCMSQQAAKDLAPLGGKARAQAMTPEELSEASRKAAEARSGSEVKTATHFGQLAIGDLLLDCAVLEDGTRVLSQGTILTALGRAPKKGRRDATARRPPFLSAENLTQFFSNDLVRMWEPITYRTPGHTLKSVGYRAEILPYVCEVYADAEREGVLTPTQQVAAHAAGVLHRGLARTGIIALVDEATGYQEFRARNELQAFLERYVSEEFRPWISRFPNEFFAQLYRIHGWDFVPGSNKRLPVVGKMINKYVYAPLGPGILERLQAVNPANEKGRRSRKHHQHLTESEGVRRLDQQIITITTFLRIARDKNDFEDMFERAFPPAQEHLPISLPIE